MQRHNRLRTFHKTILALNVSAIALSTSSGLAGAQETQPPLNAPNLKVLAYNIWNRNGSSDFWKDAQNNDFRFTEVMNNFLKAVNPDVIVYPELGNNFGSSASKESFASLFANNTINLLNEHRRTPGAYVKNDDEAPFFFSGMGDVFSYYPATDLPGNQLSINPTNGFPSVIINGIHLDYNDDPAVGRISEAKELNEFVSGSLGPVISAGDYNAADVSERGLLSADQQLKSYARDLSSSSPIGSAALDNYAISPEHRALLRSEATYWRESVTVGGVPMPRFRSVVPNWSNSSWDTALRYITAAMLARNPAIAFNNETYPVPLNIPVTLNILKQGNQLLQLEKNKDIFANSTLFDGHSTWTSDGRDNENVWQWWDRSIIDHIIASRPYAKWMVVDAKDEHSGVLNGRVTNSAGVDPSDHEPVAQNILWHGPKLVTDDTAGMVDLTFSKEDRSYNAAGEFILSRNNNRTDVRFDNIVDADGRPIYRDDVNAVGKLGRKLLNDQIADLISRGHLAPQAGIDYANDPNAALKTQIPCLNKEVLDEVAGAASLCIDSHAQFNALNIKDGVVAFDQTQALGNSTGTIALNNGGLRLASQSEAWARWAWQPVTVVEKAIQLQAGVGGFEVSDPESGVVLSNVVSGAGRFEKRGEGALLLVGDNLYEGGTSLRSGFLLAGSANAFGPSGVFDLSGGYLALGEFDLTVKSLNGSGGLIDTGSSRLTLDLAADATIATTLHGDGAVTKSGDSQLTLNGSSAHAGTFTVAQGALVVGDAAHREASLDSDVSLLSGTSIGGIGSLGSLSATGGSIIRTGNSIGTLRILRDLTVERGTTFEVEIAGDGLSDQLLVNGRATLNGGHVEVVTLDPQSSYRSGQSYRILSAVGGVEGQFETVATQSAFLDVGLRYSTDAVDLGIAVKRDFAETAVTQNERVTAESLTALEQSGESLRLFNDVLPLSEPQARPAFNALSGEIYASVNGALLEDSRFARQAANKHLLSGDKGEGITFWSDAFGAWGHTKSDGNAAKLDRNTGGLFVGGDAEIADAWQLGLFAGYGASSFDAKSRASKADVDSYTLGAYAGTWFDPVGLRVGFANSWHSVDVARAVEFGQFSETLSSSYDARTLQVFGEVSSKVEVGGTVLEPFAGLAYVKLDSDSYTEQGVSALRGTSSDEDATYSTLGMRFGDDLSIGETKGFLKGSLAWQHAFGSDVPTVQQQFATGSGFNVAGVAIAKNAALLDVGYDWQISDAATLGIAYQGQLGSGVQNHGLNAKLQIRF